ncbi:Beta-galactosidase [Handroanthus impetiginosus]|uniref:Beta-galactosidase n=1 Tax=Handroanthus impetiginosus TaxID=429701 RepID=A0A2G9HPE6_9LAMI|nr:Beta-galactosidase [Handroanthus impetiginosus]
MSGYNRIFLLLLLSSLLFASAYGRGKKNQPVVTYDGRSLIINGSRELLFSGSIHYPRSTPDMWPDLIKKAKEGGLNVIQTYVFWNIHEPVQGQYNFEGNYDLVKFIKMIGENGMWVTLRIGPYIEAEWNLGGFPYWLKKVPNITFRSYNEPFMYHMERYAEKIIHLVKKEKLFADQGGPIIMAQIENEYNNVQLAYREDGKKYVKWAADTAVGLYNGIPWVMCKQKDAPSSVISTCNGRQCGDTFPGPNGPDKPSLWTENWTAQYRVYGDSPSQRAAEDIAFAVARFFARNGTLNNYYMYHGGTNFGRTSSSFVTTRYYDEAPLDEFGLKREPKFGHLKDLHRALRLAKKPLLWGTPHVQKISEDLEITTYEKAGTNICAAFLANNDTREDATINFRGVDYYLPPKSISILPDCKTVVYNTQTVVAQHSSRNYVVSKKAKITKWGMYKENVPTAHELEVKSKSPKELYDFTNDATDYAWYSTSINLDRRDLPMRRDILPVLQVASLGHALLAFVNGEYVGFGHGSNVEKSHVLKKPINLHPGINDITLLAMTVGLPNSGAYMERRFAGPRAITLQGLMSGTVDITHYYWGQQAGVAGERMQIFTEEGAKKVNWASFNNTPTPVTWYKGYFDAPEGDNPVAIRMTSMAKGMVWVNGKSIGRYWVSYLSPLDKPTQEEYHIPRSFLKPKDNLLVVFEETGGNPEKIEILTVNRDTICSVITEYHPPHVKSWERKNNQFRSIVDPIKAAHLTCPDKKVIEKVEFVSFGDADGACGSFVRGKCDSSKAHKVVEGLCLGKTQCTIPFEREKLLDGGKDACPDIAKTLTVQVKCDAPKKSDA